MPAFRRVDAEQAGPNALGILVPPGSRTLVIARPRALAWDLLVARWNGDSASGPVFCPLARDEAAGVAHRFQAALEKAVAANRNPVETFGGPRGNSFQVWVRTDEFVWIACRRTAGQAYQPAVFVSRAEAEQAADALAAVVWPATDAEQEYYFNTQLFV